MNSYLYIIKSRILLALAYRFEVISTILCQFIILYASVFFWKAAYSHQTVHNGTTGDQMIQYTILSTLLAVFYSTQVENALTKNVRKGNVAVDFIKPISILGSYFAADIGTMLSNLMIKFLPLFVLGGLLFQFPLPVSLPAFLLFLLSTCLGFLILWSICAIFGLFTFWIIQLGPIGTAKNFIIRFLSGSFVPIWFFPSGVQRVIYLLPFVHIYQTPLSIYIGRLPVSQAWGSLLIQAVWAVLMLLCLHRMQKVAFKKVVVQGG